MPDQSIPQTSAAGLPGLAPAAHGGPRFDRVNAFIAAAVTIISGVVYWMTVQPTVSFWDCGEFIACSYILGIPHPPGSPLFIIIGRLFSALPIAADVAFRVNMISVISSAFITLFAYLIVVRMISYWYSPEQRSPLTRLIGYVGGFTGAMFAAFSRTNWGNAVEAEVYGLTLMLTLAIFWLALKFFEARGTSRSFRYLALAVYLALLGVGIHLTVFLVVPVAAIFFVMKKDAREIHWVYICTFLVVELLLIFVFSFTNITNSVAPPGATAMPYKLFLGISAVLLGYLGYKLYHHINVPWVIALAASAGIMLGFWPFILGLALASVGIVIYGRIVPSSTWRSALVVVLFAVLGFSVNIFVPIRSSVNPRIDENNPSKDFTTFVNFLERKQYGQMSMTERMFVRRGKFENQFGRHPHMGFWSYFEEQYSPSRWGFTPFFLLGLVGVYFTMRKRMEIGYPFFALLLLTSVGLVLYMNFADGMEYNPNNNDAYLEVRNRDYFFTPAFILFGMAIGLGAAAIMELIRSFVAENQRKVAVYGSSAVAALSVIPLQHSWFVNDRSQNYFPYDYAYNILNSAPPEASLFTSGDNDTFPVWCLQEAFRERRDVKVVNLSLLNTDWYVEQMKNRFGVPMDLTDEQIVYREVKEKDRVVQRPPEMFTDRARRRKTFLVPQPHQGRVLKVQDMMMDEICLSSIQQDKDVCFTSEPYAESPLGWNRRRNQTGILKTLALEPFTRMIDVDKSYDLYINTYQMRGLNNPAIYKDDNATGVMISFGFSAIQVFNEYIALATIADSIQAMEARKAAGGLSTDEQDVLDSAYAGMDGHSPSDSALFRERAITVIDTMIARYPEFWMNYIVISDYYLKRQDTATALDYLYRGERNLREFHEYSPDNANYVQDLGLIKFEIAKLLGDQDDQSRMDESLDLLWEGFTINENSGMAYQKLVQYLFERRRNTEIMDATRRHAAYGLNYHNNPNVQAILGSAPAP